MIGLPEAPPNRLSDADLHLRPGPDGVAVEITPERAGWRYLSFRAASPEPGHRLVVGGAGLEVLVVTIAGGVRVVTDGRAIELPGRRSPFDGLPWAAYLPAGRSASLEALGAGSIVAIASAPVRGVRREAAAEPIVIGPEDIAVEIRGAGDMTRQISHIVPPGFPAERLLAVEALTPAGNRSSWPPHKHDVDAMPGEAVLEEVYHYRFRRPEGTAVQRLYRRPGTALHRSSGPRDASWTVRSGDVVLVTDGYHPFAASPDDDAWYLNALAGDRRTMACSFDPDFDADRARWAGLPTDPRVPLVPAVNPAVSPEGGR